MSVRFRCGVALAALLSLLVQKGEADDRRSRGAVSHAEIAHAWDAVVSRLEWEKRWFGAIYGGHCYDKMVGREVTLRILKFAPSSRYAPLGSFNCKYHEGSTAEPHVTSGGFMIQVKDATALTWDVVGEPEIRGWPGKMRSGGIPPYDEDRCQDRAADKFFGKYKADRDTTVGEYKVRIPKIMGRSVATMPTAEERTIVEKAVVRSMKAYLRKKERTGKTTMEGTGKKAGNVTGGPLGTLFLGRYELSDQELLVYYPADNTVYDLDFPHLDVLAHERNCMEVGIAYVFEGFVEMGGARGQERMRSLIDKIKADGTMLIIDLDRDATRPAIADTEQSP